MYGDYGWLIIYEIKTIEYDLHDNLNKIHVIKSKIILSNYLLCTNSNGYNKS